MTDIEKAIEYLKEPTGKPLEVHYKSINLAISALEKQMPKKPIIDRGIYKVVGGGKCPSCKKEFAQHPKICDDCGQAIDWSVKE